MPRAMLLGAERREEKELDFEPSDDEDRRKNLSFLAVGIKKIGSFV